MSEARRVLSPGLVDVQIFPFLPKTGAQDPVPTECSCHEPPSALPLKLTRGSRAASPVSLSADCRAWQTRNFMPVKSDAHGERCVSGCRRLPGVTSEELHEGAKVMICAVPDTESSVGVLEIGLHLQTTVSGSRIQRHFF